MRKSLASLQCNLSYRGISSVVPTASRLAFVGQKNRQLWDQVESSTECLDFKSGTDIGTNVIGKAVISLVDRAQKVWD